MTTKNNNLICTKCGNIMPLEESDYIQFDDEGNPYCFDCYEYKQFVQEVNYENWLENKEELLCQL